MIALTARDLSIDLSGRRVLSDMTLALAQGSVLGLIGPNGSGKTTLLRALAGLVPLCRGSVEILGQAAEAMDPRARARALAYLPQGHDSHWNVTVTSLVALGRLPYRGAWSPPSDSDRAAIAAAMEATDVLALADRPVDRISGGERARVMLARALAGTPRILLADEPVAGLDPAHQLDVMRALRGLAAGGAGVIVVLHDLTLAARFCDRLLLLHGGSIRAEGVPDDVLTPKELAACYGVAAHRGSVEGARFVVPLHRVPVVESEGGSDVGSE